MAVDRGLQDQPRIVEPRSATGVHTLSAGGQEPHAPVRPCRVLRRPFDMQQCMPREVGRFAQRKRALQQRRAADRKDRGREQPFDMQAGISAGTVADRQVDAVPFEIGESFAGVQSKVDFRFPFAEPLQPRDQPFRGDRRGRADGQQAVVARLRQRLRCRGQQFETLAQRRQRRLRLVGQQQRPGQPAEQRVSAMGLQRLDLMADRRRRDMQLLGGLRETQMTRCGLEGTERIERCDPVGHASRIS